MDVEFENVVDVRVFAVPPSQILHLFNAVHITMSVKFKYDLEGTCVFQHSRQDCFLTRR